MLERRFHKQFPPHKSSGYLRATQNLLSLGGNDKVNQKDSLKVIFIEKNMQCYQLGEKINGNGRKQV
jgi:hypothetical protein